MDDISKLFHDDVRDKKRAASGVYHRTGKRGYVGSVRLTSDLLSGKEKREYQRPGRVNKYNMYDNIVSFEEFESLSLEDKKKYLSNYRERHSNKEIMKAWGINHNRFYRIVNELDLPKLERRRTNNKKDANNMSKTLSDNSDKLEAVNELDKKEKENGMTLSLNGVYDAEDIVKRLEKFSIMLTDEDTKFKVELKITEL